MQIKTGQTQPISANSGTIGGLMMYAYIQAAVANTPLVPTDFNTTLIQVQATLFRMGKAFTIFNSNWQFLGTYFTRKNNFFSFINGQQLVAPAGGVKQIILRSSWLKFESPITLKGTDNIVVEVQFLDGAAGAAVDTAVSFIDFSLQPSTSREFGIPRTKIEVVQQNVSEQSFVKMDRVKRIHFMNFDQTSLVTPVIASCNVLSKGLSYSANYQQLIASENYKWPDNQAYQYGANIGGAATVTRTNNYLPQCFTIYEGGPAGMLLDGCEANFNFNTANVNASQNWVGSTSLQ